MTNTSNNDNIKDMILKTYPDYPDLSCAELWELMDKCLKQGYTKALTNILKRLRYRQAKITNLWINTRLKEYEYAKMVLEEEITLIAKLEKK